MQVLVLLFELLHLFREALLEALKLHLDAVLLIHEAQSKVLLGLQPFPEVLNFLFEFLVLHLRVMVQLLMPLILLFELLNLIKQILESAFFFPLELLVSLPLRLHSLLHLRILTVKGINLCLELLRLFGNLPANGEEVVTLGLQFLAALVELGVVSRARVLKHLCLSCGQDAQHVLSFKVVHASQGAKKDLMLKDKWP
jgi:hypothetical protein